MVAKRAPLLKSESDKNRPNIRKRIKFMAAQNIIQII